MSWSCASRNVTVNPLSTKSACPNTSSVNVNVALLEIFAFALNVMFEALVISEIVVPAVTPVPLTSIPSTMPFREPLKVTSGLSVTAPFTVNVFEYGAE